MWLLAAAALAAVAVIAGVLVVVLSGSDTTTTVPKASDAVQLTVATASVQSAGAPVPTFPSDAQAQTMAALSGYVEAASVKPLRTGAVDATALAGLFDPTAAARLTGPDRATLVDEGLPKAVGNIKATAAVTLTGLAGADGKLILTNASFDLQIVAKAPKGAVRIQRTGSMIFAPAADGSWKITGWHLSVDRNAPGLPVTPTSAGAGTPTTARSAATTTTAKK